MSAVWATAMEIQMLNLWNVKVKCAMDMADVWRIDGYCVAVDFEVKA